MTTTTAIGRHRTVRTGDLMHMTFAGPLTSGDLELMRAMMDEMLTAGGACFLVADMSGCTGIEASARKYMAEWSKTGGQQVTGIAVYGLTFAIRTMVSLALSAIKFLGTQQVEVVFVRDEAEALAWIGARRRARVPTSA